MGTVRILFVCTANVCRSPIAEHLARRHPGGDRFEFVSAGLLRDGTPCPDRLVDVVSARGLDLSEHRSRAVTERLLAEADLVVTMEVAHLQELVLIDPAVFTKTVPLRELDEMLRQRPRTVPELLDELATRDPGAYLGAGPLYDVEDPYGGSGRAYRRAIEHIDGLVQSLTSRLLLPGEPPPADQPPATTGTGASSFWRRFTRDR